MRATLTVKYPTTADRVPDGGDDAGAAARGVRGGRGQGGHDASIHRERAASTENLEIIDGRAGSGRCNKQTAAIRGAVTQPRQPELNADSVLPPFVRFSAVFSGRALYALCIGSTTPAYATSTL